MTAHSALADRLLSAYADRTPIPRITAEQPGLTIDDAYAIQQHQVSSWAQAGDPVRGHKVGLTSKAMQSQLGVDFPDYGRLTASMFLPEGAAIPADRFLQPRVEPEIAFVMGRRLAGPGATVADAARAVDVVLPALEIIDSRIRDWDIRLIDTIADNASSGGVVLGGTPRRLEELDLRLMGVLVHRNGELVATGAGAAVLGSPLNALAWLANVLGARGVAIEEGDTVIPGSMTSALPVRAGDSFHVEFAELGSVTARFAAA
ncbi:2-keto-4-pentenoate hydratase [Mycobacterium sp. 360MFTsu5.1]|uniref:2-keto-4-pentenoate hydratase n=1 Tax=Mycobacterium sp. 360MFTsu5.1 TaxID=1172186 RepID=UPI000379FA41|nr:2-keto-4-pentenoate hydratase [Mycobacterium sp. 360MFTsu5.1]